MFLLPTFNARLLPCPVDKSAFTPHAQGQFCRQCQRVVQDFSRSADPVADLAAARAAAPDGRVCGSFASSQVQRPKLTQRLRWFVVALVLVVGQGLTAREALAQVRKAAPKHPVKTQPKPATIAETVVDGYVAYGDVPVEPPSPDSQEVYSYAEQMPRFRGNDYAALVAYIQKQLVWPKTPIDAEGNVFLSFVVNPTGAVSDAKVIKGIHPLLDAEALRVARTLTGFTPGRQHGQAVKVRLTIPVKFRRD